MPKDNTVNPVFRKSIPAVLTARHLALFFVALLPLFSSLITAVHYHDDFSNRLDCAVCRSEDDLSSGNSQEPLSLIPVEVVVLSCVTATWHFVTETFVSSLNSRAPPASALAAFI